METNSAAAHRDTMLSNLIGRAEKALAGTGLVIQRRRGVGISLREAE